MKLKKTLTLIVLSLFLISFLSYALPVKAYSTETTGLNTYGFDNSQQTYVKAGGYNIFAFENKILFYDDNSILIKTYTPGALSYETNCTRIAVLKVSDSLILIAKIGGNQFADQYNHKAYLSYIVGTLDINTLSYTSISSGYQDVGDWTFQAVSSVGMQGTGLVLLANTNTTGSFFYMWFSGQVIMAGQSGSLTGGSGNFFSYLGKYIASTWTSGYSLKQSSTANIWLYTNALAITQDMPLNYGYVICSNNYHSGNRAVVYQVNFNANTVSYIGTTGLDNSYTGSYVVGSAFYDGFTYLMGVATYSNKVIVNFASSNNFGSGLLVGSIIFNSSYVSQSFLSNAVASNSVVDRPFSVALPNTFGNISGIFSIGYFDDILGHNANGLVLEDANGRIIEDFNGHLYATETGYISYSLLSGYYWHNATNTYLLHIVSVNNVYVGNWNLCGWSITLSGLETATPTWSDYQFGFQWTPQTPQSFPYTSSWSWGGFQPVGSTVGLFVDMVQYQKCEATLMYPLNSALAFNGILNGDIFSNTVLSIAPTQISLKQGQTYTFTGNVYVNNFLTGSGSYSAGVSELSISAQTAFSSTPSSYTTTSFNDGVFTFSLTPRTASAIVYQLLKVNFTLSTGETYTATYDLAFYPYGSTNNPSPTPNTSGGINQIDPGMLSGGMNTFINFLLLFLVIGGPAIMLGIKAGSAGFLGGAVLGLGIGVMANLIPFWFIFVVAVGCVAVIVLWRNNNTSGGGQE
jgi:hypothetical protein